MVDYCVCVQGGSGFLFTSARECVQVDEKSI